MSRQPRTWPVIAATTDCLPLAGDDVPIGTLP
jgi:hypothetical protein